MFRVEDDYDVVGFLDPVEPRHELVGFRGDELCALLSGGVRVRVFAVEESFAVGCVQRLHFADVAFLENRLVVDPRVNLENVFLVISGNTCHRKIIQKSNYCFMTSKKVSVTYILYILYS